MPGKEISICGIGILSVTVPISEHISQGKNKVLG
jgi:hypothetical protein